MSIASAVTGQPPCEIQKVSAFDAAALDQFGFSTSMNKDIVVVGSPQDADEGEWTGAGYIYRHSPVSGLWEFEQKVLSSDADQHEFFGHAVDVWNDVIAISARRDHNPFSHAGSVSVFRMNESEWIEEQRLTASDAAEEDWFGTAVELEDDLLLVGARRNDDACPEDPDCNSGAAYIFRYDGREWLEEQKLLGSTSASGDWYGDSGAVGVTSGGETAFVGARFNDDLFFHSGAVYVYVYDSEQQLWIETQKLTASDASTDAQFGSRVSLFGDVLVVTAVKEDSVANQSGAAYIFHYDVDLQSWVEVQKIKAAEPMTDALFGQSADFDGQTLIVGADVAGLAYLFRPDAEGKWAQIASFTGSDVGRSGDEFGIGSAVWSDAAVVGADEHDLPFENAGTVYFYSAVLADGDGDDLCSVGPPGDLDGDGDVDFADLLVLLNAWGACADCPIDLDDSGDVGFADLLILLSNWS